MIEYKWRNGARTKGNAQACGERIEEIGANGAVTPALVVDDAKSKASPLHEAFEWNNGKAAHQHRLYQARHLLADLVVHVIVEERDEKPIVVRAFHVAESDEAEGYYPLARVLSDEEMHAQVIARALREAESWYARHAIYTELAPIGSAIRMVRETTEAASPSATEEDRPSA